MPSGQEHSCKSTRDGNRMGRQDGDSSQDGLRLVKDAQLPQHGAAVVVDFLPGQSIIGIEAVDPAQRELNSPASCGKTAPSAEVSAANSDFDENGVVRDMPSLHFDSQVRQRIHQLPVKKADFTPPGIVFGPGLIVVLRSVAESAKNAFEVMLILQSNMLFYGCSSGQLSVFRKRRVGHIPPLRFQCLAPGTDRKILPPGT